jgi:hypothetical protein
MTPRQFNVFSALLSSLTTMAADHPGSSPGVWSLIKIGASELEAAEASLKTETPENNKESKSPKRKIKNDGRWSPVKKAVDSVLKSNPNVTTVNSLRAVTGLSQSGINHIISKVKCVALPGGASCCGATKFYHAERAYLALKKQAERLKNGPSCVYSRMSVSPDHVIAVCTDKLKELSVA